METPSLKVREGVLMGFVHRNIFRVRLYNGVEIVATMPDELLSSFDPNVQLTKYNRPYVDVEIHEFPLMSKIIAVRRSGMCGMELPKFFEYDA
jgi:hypothetical protein